MGRHMPVTKKKLFLSKIWTLYIGLISFVFHFLELMQKAEWGAIVFSSWVEVISSRRPKLPETCLRNTASVTLKGIENFNQVQNIFFPSNNN